MADQQPQIDMNTLPIVQMLCNGIMPLHLDPTLSINFSKIVRYEPYERTRTETKGEGKNAVEIEVGTGEFDPAIVFEGGEITILTPEQNEIFRLIWNDFSQLSHYIFTAARVLASAVQPAAAAAVAGETQEVPQ